MNIWRRVRDAITGRFATKDYAKANPDTTVSEKVDPAKLAREFKKANNQINGDL